MLKISFDLVDGSYVVSINGHAGAAEIGKDLVCASASILAYTLAQVVKDAQAQKLLRKKPTIKLDEGKALITCKPKKDACDLIEVELSVISRGYQLLAHNYPQYVELKLFGEPYKKA